MGVQDATSLCDNESLVEAQPSSDTLPLCFNSRYCVWGQSGEGCQGSYREVGTLTVVTMATEQAKAARCVWHRLLMLCGVAGA